MSATRPWRRLRALPARVPQRRRRIEWCWSCSDFVRHEHRWRWTAAVCGRAQWAWRALQAMAGNLWP